jgi:hypothetical protein
VRASLVVVLAALAACGGGQGQPSGDAASMAGWVHRDDGKFAYFVPDDKWIGVESMSGIDISSPTGNADVSLAFAYGPLVPTTVQGVEALAFTIFSNVSVKTQSAIGPGPLGSRRTTEFTAVWKATGNNVHGILNADVGNQVIDAYLIMANTGDWPQMAVTLQLIRDHITYFGRSPM